MLEVVSQFLYTLQSLSINAKIVRRTKVIPEKPRGSWLVYVRQHALTGPSEAVETPVRYLCRMCESSADVLCLGMATCNEFRWS